MKRLLTSVLFLLCLISTVAFARPDYSVIRDYARLVVISRPVFNDRLVPYGSGTAIVIAPGYALTAWHVVQRTEEQGHVVTIMEGNREVRIKVVKKDEANDVALISGDFACPCAPIAVNMPEVDTPITLVGFPLYHMFRLQYLTHGHYQGMAGSERDKIGSTAPAAEGASGGGLFYKDGDTWRLFGIVEAIGATPLGPPQLGIQHPHNWLSFAVPLPVIQKLLEGTNVRVR